MKINKYRLASFLAFLSLASLVGCSSTNQQKQITENVDTSSISAVIIVPFKKLSFPNIYNNTQKFARDYAQNNLYDKVVKSFKKINGTKIKETNNHYILEVTASENDISQICKQYKLDRIEGNTFFSWKGVKYPQIIDYNDNSTPMHLSKDARQFTGYGISAIRQMYDIPNSDTGINQWVGMISAGRPNQNDLDFYAKMYHIGYTPLTYINNAAVNSESTIDYESIRATAPKANISVYSADSNSLADFTIALSFGISDFGELPNAHIISISWGIPELELPRPIMEIWHSLFLEAQAQGISFVASTGDNGRTDGTSRTTVDYPASDPLVIAVGGISKQPSHAAVAWGPSGAGHSKIWNDESSISNITRQIKVHVPDVSLLADQFWGFRGFINGKPMKIGGTSIAAPMFAGIMADVEQSTGKPVLNARRYIYSLSSSRYTDVIQGSSSDYRAITGYDMATGFGIPDMAKMITNVK